jgi:hypothetical protein
MFKIGVRNGSAFHSLRADRCFLRRCYFCNGHNRQAHLTSTRCDDLATTINPAKDRPGGGLCILEIGRSWIRRLTSQQRKSRSMRAAAFQPTKRRSRLKLSRTIAAYSRAALPTPSVPPSPLKPCANSERAVCDGRQNWGPFLSAGVGGKTDIPQLRRRSAAWACPAEAGNLFAQGPSKGLRRGRDERRPHACTEEHACEPKFTRAASRRSAATRGPKAQPGRSRSGGADDYPMDG